MNSILIVRQAFGFSQEAMAQLLGIQLGLLKMAETNRRNLPQKALTRLLWMEKLVENLLENKTTPVFPAEAVSFLLLKTRKKKRETDLLVKAIDTKRKQMQNLVEVQTAFDAMFPAETHPSESLRMDALVFNARIFPDQQDLELELDLRTRQAGLAAMIAFLEKQA